MRVVKFRVRVSNVIAGAASQEWKRYWRDRAVEAGHEIVSTDDEIAQEYKDGWIYLVGEVKR